MPIANTAALSCPKEVLSRVLDGEAVLLHLGSGMYFGMNEVATRAWELITRGETYGALVTKLIEEFEVEEETLRADLERFVYALVEKKLVTVA
jgi:hypothetical protein